MRASTALVVLSAAVASAQSTTTGNYTSELDMIKDFNAQSVQPSQRAVWCRAQTNTCGLLCDNNTNKNSCAQEDLKFECTCASNNSAPGLQYYTQTVPTFICETLFSQCNSQQVGNADGQMGCLNNIQNLCGKAAPPKGGVSSDSKDGGDSSSSSASSPQPTGSRGSSSSNGAVSSSTSGGLAAPTMAPAGKGAVAAAAFGLVVYIL
ncbi:hypothetical protein CDD83_938 [Cordyceps sp. RAO-2017]|nr:hypothetical protein CDD83_938 [Cordyceps sp. RAO-2017]